MDKVRMFFTVGSSVSFAEDGTLIIHDGISKAKFIMKEKVPDIVEGKYYLELTFDEIDIVYSFIADYWYELHYVVEPEEEIEE